MELIFQQQTIKYDNIPTAEVIIEKINGLLEKDYYFSHFIVDGTEVFENHETYLNKNLDRIGQIEIVAKTVEEFLNDILLSAEDYIKRAIPELRTLAEEFYGNSKSETWDRLDQLLEGLQWLNEMLSVIDDISTTPFNWEKYLQISSTLNHEIENLSEAIANKDDILIGDIIQYELIPNFEALSKEIQKTIDTEGTRHDLN